MKMKKRFLGILLSLVMVLGLMTGMTLVAKAEATQWVVGDSINLNGKYFIPDDMEAAKVYLGIDESVAIPQPEFDSHMNQWRFRCEIPATVAHGYVYCRLRSGKTKEEAPAGFKIAGGTGTSDDPYTFGLVYQKDVDDAKVIAQAMKEVHARMGSDMISSGSPIQLIDPPTTVLPDGYSMVYAVTVDNTAPDSTAYGASIPTAIDAGTYYVWYKVKGDENHSDTAPAGPLTVTISERVAETVTITFDAAGGTGTMAPVQIEKGSQYTFPKSSFIPPANKVFAYWKIGEKQYAVNDKITVTADLTVTAVWTEKTEDKESKIVPADLTSVPDELKNKFSSIKDLKDALLRAILSQGMFASEENSVFYDVVLMVRRNGGSWKRATKEDFEDGPLTVKLEYPAGTGRNTHDFSVAHMFTVAMHGQPGAIETPAVTKGEDGITVELDGLSPVAISWTKIDEKAIDSLPHTGDTERPLLYGLAVLFALIGIGWLTKKK